MFEPEIKRYNEQYRILIPSEYEALLEAIPKERSRIVVEALAMTGMRYSELSMFSHSLKWFDAKNRAISLPSYSTKTEKGRVVHLTAAFSKRLDMYLREHKKLEVPSIITMAENLKRWQDNVFDTDDGIHETAEGTYWFPTPKSFRKTWESWLLAAGYPSMAVALSQGHSELIAYKHYATLDPRLKSEMDAVHRLTAGWGT